MTIIVFIVSIVVYVLAGILIARRVKSAMVPDSRHSLTHSFDQSKEIIKEEEQSRITA